MVRSPRPGASTQENDVGPSPAGGSTVSSRSHLGIVLFSLVLGLTLLHILLLWLWPERPKPGFLGVSRPLHEQDGLGNVMALPLLLALFYGVAVRISATHPRALSAFRLSGRVGGAGRAWARLLLLYLAAALASGFVDAAFTYHFASSLGNYVAMVLLFAAACTAGRRRPFLHLGTRHALDPSPHNRRRAANFGAMALALLIYVQWIYHEEIGKLAYQVGTVAWLTILVCLSVVPVAFAWLLLHGSCATAAARLVLRLDSQAPGQDSRPEAKGTLGAGLELLAHLGAAALVLILTRLAHLGVQSLWQRDAWLLPQGAGNQLFLGVDWYWLRAYYWTHNAEILVMIAFLLVASACLRDALRNP